jgi:hypothetical protein
MARRKTNLAPTVTSPAKMGEAMAHPAPNSAQSPNAKLRPRGGAKSDAPVGTIQGVRPGHQERLGAKFAPQMPLYAPNAAAAADTGKNVRVLPSAVGNRDFYLKRQYGQVQQ